jgi:hypothetical protein
LIGTKHKAILPFMLDLASSIQELLPNQLGQDGVRWNWVSKGLKLGIRQLKMQHWGRRLLRKARNGNSGAVSPSNSPMQSKATWLAKKLDESFHPPSSILRIHYGTLKELTFPNRSNL